MDYQAILAKTDHTLLKQEAAWEQIREIVDDGIAYQTASVCIPPSFVEQAAQYAAGRVKICTVIGFPNGYCTTAAKAFEAKDAVSNGADEVDMVINIGMVKECRWEAILHEIKAVREACPGRILKVIVETCLLTEGEKIELCRIVSESGADYIKTSTGFSTGGATFEDVSLFQKHISNGVKIKASGGIKSLEDAEKFLTLGAERLGTSQIVKIIKTL